jgi:2'-5' RNA ligase
VSAGGVPAARLFVALELPVEAREELARWQAGVLSLVPGIRPVRVEDLHVTLCFLGSRPEQEIESIGAACGVVAGEPVFESQLGEAVWLPARRPRVLAVTLSDPSGEAARIQSTVSRALVSGGWYAPESRPFLPHVTVARASRDARVRAVSLPAPPEVAVRCSRVTLFQSRLGAGGARYSGLASFELGSFDRGSFDRGSFDRGSFDRGSFDRGSVPEAADPMSVVRRFYDAQGRLYGGSALAAEEVRAMLDPSVVWHVPGASAIAGEHHGVEAVLAYFDTRRRMTDSTFRVSVQGAAMIAGRVVQLAGGAAVLDGREVSWETVGVFRVADGRIAECWLVPFDQAVFDEIWS